MDKDGSMQFLTDILDLVFVLSCKCSKSASRHINIFDVGYIDAILIANTFKKCPEKISQKITYVTHNLAETYHLGLLVVPTVLPAKSDSYVMLCLQSY